MIGDWEIQKMADEISRLKAKSVAIQFPDGLRRKIVDIAFELQERTNVEIYLWGDPCYGACDVADAPVDLIFHLGHAPLPHIESKNVVYMELQSEFPETDLLERAVPFLEGKVGLISSVQYIPELLLVKQFLASKGLVGRIGEGDLRISYPGQVLGCNFSSARSIADDVDMFLYIGGGDFHPIGVALATGKRIVVLDPEKNEVRDVEDVVDEMKRLRFAVMEKAKSADIFGIIISRKIGQERFKLASSIEKLLDKKGKKSVTILIDYVTPENLIGLTVDAFVSTACPRIAIDDQARFDKPILTPIELRILLEEQEWKDYSLDEILETDSFNSV
ncbi:MAG: diphthamide biosynthesis enzyme Dph2 [Thermoplasmata archaeon]